MLARKLLISILPVLVLLAAAELLARRGGDLEAYETPTGFVEADAELMWRLRPQPAGPLATNGIGLRDTAYNENAEVKVLLLGDSVSWGNGINDVRRVYPYVLERRLAKRGVSRSVEVINAGVPGYSTFQELRYLELYGLQLDPDVIVLQFCLNDVVERYRALAEYGGNDYFLGIDTRAAVGGLYGKMLRNSRAFENLVRFLQRRVRDYEEYRGENLARDDLSRENERAWQQVMAEIDGVRVVAAKNSIPLVLLIAPYRFQLSSPATLRQPQDRLLAYSGEHGLPVIDLLPDFAEAKGVTAGTLFIDPTHFSPAGHALAARSAARTLAVIIETLPGKQ